MSNQLESRFITYPDILEKSPNHTVLLIDADLDDVANLATFCSVSQRNYDIYLYKGSTGDFQWLSHLSNRLDTTFIRDGSHVKATAGINYNTVNTLKDYFTKIDSEQLTNA